MSNCFTGVDIVGIISNESGDRLAKSCERNKDGNFDIEYWNGEKVTIAADDAYKKPISVSTIKPTSIKSCQSCGKPFNDCDIVYFVPIDNNIVCPECAYKHDSREKRIVEGEGKYLNRFERMEYLTKLLMSGGINLSKNEELSLMWVSSCGIETYDGIYSLLEKCLKVVNKYNTD